MDLPTWYIVIATFIISIHIHLKPYSTLFPIIYKNKSFHRKPHETYIAIEQSSNNCTENNCARPFSQLVRKGRVIRAIAMSEMGNILHCGWYINLRLQLAKYA